MDVRGGQVFAVRELPLEKLRKETGFISMFIPPLIKVSGFKPMDGIHAVITIGTKSPAFISPASETCRNQ
jgi:hypothetical protein